MNSARDVLRDERERDFARRDNEKREVLEAQYLPEDRRRDLLAELESRYQIRWRGLAWVVDGKTQQEHTGDISEILRDGDTANFYKITMSVPFPVSGSRSVRTSLHEEFWSIG